MGENEVTMYLLIINFIVDGVIILGIYLLFMKNTSRGEWEKQKEIAREIEGTFQSYLEEIREENRKFAQNAASPEPPPVAEKKKGSFDRNYEENAPLLEFHPAVVQSRDKVEFSEERKVKEMAEEGKTVEEIARQLGTGKTEVEMMMRLIRRYK